jgi:hypothetical protein
VVERGKFCGMLVVAGEKAVLIVYLQALRKEKDKSRADGPGGGPPGRGEQDANIRAAVEAAGLGGGNVRGVGANWADAGF